LSETKQCETEIETGDQEQDEDGSL